jgi:hypothetical protein
VRRVIQEEIVHIVQFKIVTDESQDGAGKSSTLTTCLREYVYLIKALRQHRTINPSVADKVYVCSCSSSLRFVP